MLLAVWTIPGILLSQLLPCRVQLEALLQSHLLLLRALHLERLVLRHLLCGLLVVEELLGPRAPVKADEALLGQLERSAVVCEGLDLRAAARVDEVHGEQ